MASKEFVSENANKSISHLLSDERSRQIKESREYLLTVIDVLKFTNINILLQPERDNSESSNRRGNFLDLLHLIGKYNKLANVLGNTKYTSKEVQNEQLTLTDGTVQNSIACKVIDIG